MVLNLSNELVLTKEQLQAALDTIKAKDKLSEQDEKTVRALQTQIAAADRVIAATEKELESERNVSEANRKVADAEREAKLVALKQVENEKKKVQKAKEQERACVVGASAGSAIAASLGSPLMAAPGAIIGCVAGKFVMKVIRIFQ